MTHAFHFLWESALFVCRVRATLKTPSTSNNNQKKSYMNKIQSKCNWRKRYSHHIKLSLILLAWSVACTRKLMGSLLSCTLQQITFVGIVNNMSYLTVAFKTAMKRKKKEIREITGRKAAFIRALWQIWQFSTIGLDILYSFLQVSMNYIKRIFMIVLIFEL